MPNKHTHNKQSISRQFFKQIIGIISIITFFSILYFTLQEINRFEKEKKIIKNKYYERKKEFIKSQVDNAVSYINYQKENTESRLQEKLKNRVNLAYQIADNIYTKNKGKYSKEQIALLIKDALRPIRFDNGRGYYFIGNLNGTDELYPIAPEYEGKNLINLQDVKGNYVMQDEIKAAKNKNGGFVTHYWKKTQLDSGMIYPKLSYVKAFEHLNWYIGTGEYNDDFTKDIQKEVLNRISKIRFGDEGYVFVNTYDGQPLITDGKIVKEVKNIWELEDPNGVKVIQEERKAVENPEGDYIYYVWNKLTKPEPAAKISFIKGISDWEWLVGAGVYVDEIEEEILLLRSKLNKQITLNLIKVVSIIVLIYILLFLFAKRFSSKIQSSVYKLSEFFTNASKSLVELDSEEIEFTEFKTIAKSANRMIKNRISIEKELVIEKTHFEKLFENAPAAIIILNKESKIDKTNNIFLQTFDLEESELVNKNVYDCFSFAKDKVFKSFLENIKSGSIDVIQLSHISNKSKSEIIFSVTGTTISIENEFLGIFLLFSNITEEIRIKESLKLAKEQAEKSDMLKTAFLSNMSHEIRTPMNAIIGFSDLLSDPNMDSKLKANYISIIKSSGNTLLNLINDIIDIAKIESGQLNIVNEITELNSVLADLFNTYLKKIKTLSKPINLKLINKVDQDGSFVLTDPHRLKQVFINLLENSVKFTSSGEIEFGIFSETNNEILFYVRDTGIGIPQDKIDLIFQRFSQVESSLSRRFGGTGLGLSISKSIVELMDGNIWFESKENVGTTFYFTIKNNQPIDNEKKIKNLDEDFSDFDWEKYKILIVEDNIPNYLLLKAYLQKSGVKITHAINGEDALKEFVGNNSPDLVLLDIQLPDISGYEVASEIKKLNSNTKIIAQTAFAMSEDKQKALENNCDDYLAKPIKKKTLLTQINKLLTNL
jgi:PAS domain S-box-containing protein